MFVSVMDLRVCVKFDRVKNDNSIVSLIKFSAPISDSRKRYCSPGSVNEDMMSSIPWHFWESRMYNVVRDDE